MAVGDINAGYMGYAVINGQYTRFSDANLAVRQEVLAPDLIMGNYNRMAYVYGPASVDGSISGPITENFSTGVGNILDWAVERVNCGRLNAHDVDLYYFCNTDTGGSRSFSDLYVNSLNISCTAGDLANFSIDLVGAGPSDQITWGTGLGSTVDAATMPEEKLLTWDALSLTASGDNAPNSDYYSAFDFTISNNVEPVYALHSTDSDYFPFDLIPGLRTITGTLSAYNVPTTSSGAENYSDDPHNAAGTRGTIVFNIGTATVTIECKFHRVEPTSSVGPIISTVGFTGLGPNAITIA